ncbi:MAG: hypothetical protein QOD53_1653 [Thermoleophilaceae bacterium]|nr:hypothetical protein [Thermoleophilaceae bacterium]
MATHDDTYVMPIDPLTDPRWDAFVRASPEAGAYHLGAWAAVLQAAYGFRPEYLALVDSRDQLRGALPIMGTRGLATGRRLRSLPVVPPAGPLAMDEDGKRALIEAACRLTDEKARIWTLHSRGEGAERLVPELRPLPKHPTYILDLSADVDELRRGWKKTSNNLFRNLRKADKAGVTVREGRDESDLRAFYELYLRTMRRRLSLPRSYRQLSEDRRLLGPDGTFRLFLAEHEGRIVSGGVFHSFGDTLDLLYNGSDDSRLEVRPNHALYWHAIVWAVQAGHTRLDFGHARPGSSLARFKEQWAAQEVPEYRYDYVPGAPPEAEQAETTSRPLHGRGREGALERVWPRLPLGATRAAARIAYRWL